MATTTSPLTADVRASHRKVCESFMDSRTTPFRRQDLAAKLYPLTTPRSRDRADILAKKLMDELAKQGRIIRHGHLHWQQVSKSRKLHSGREVPELNKTVTMKLDTRCPQKWAAIDMESGEVWMGDSKGLWTRPTTEQMAELADQLAPSRNKRR
ncbi:hypothetical protein [Acidovorax sp. sic0104]|uniref:hypothetical protein n=1 Tax=Acidovorax sp. sic0104 TaxID=2854784 RepID=UPI001C47E046|nr:hypothetical protein [Acidovorax sp. sic0104]MBV7542076.1 hypothetical protein [Acidovorax sp. sic0104]